MKTFFNGTWYTVERNENGGADMTRDISLLDICFSIAMLAMGAMLLSFAVDCDTASIGTKTLDSYHLALDKFKTNQTCFSPRFPPYIS